MVPAVVPVRVDIAVVILTHDEAIHIERAIRSVADFAAQIIVVDSFSNDNTIALAEAAGAVVLCHRFVNQAQQFAWALANAPITARWILRLDADEVIGTDLAEEIVRRLPHLPADVAGITFNRRHIFMGRWIRHGGRYPLTLLRLWRHGQGRVEQRWMDEHVVVWGGRTIAFTGVFEDRNEKDLTFFTAKHNAYATREAIEILCERHCLPLANTDDTAGSVADAVVLLPQARRKRAIKQIYNRIPFALSTLAYFLLRYVVQLGFLDGRPGLIYHGLQGFWYRFLVGAKVAEWEPALLELSDPTDKLGRLSAMTGYDLSPRGLTGSSLSVTAPDKPPAVPRAEKRA